MRARVKWFNNTMKYGFTEPIPGFAPGGAFIHWTQIRGDGYRVVAKGEEIEFDLELRPRGYAAENIYVVEETRTGRRLRENKVSEKMRTKSMIKNALAVQPGGRP